jgi:hypothetical protein
MWASRRRLAGSRMSVGSRPLVMIHGGTKSRLNGWGVRMGLRMRLWVWLYLRVREMHGRLLWMLVFDHGGLRVAPSTGSQRGSQCIDLLLELGDSAVGLLLPLATRGSDYTLSASLCASLAGAGGIAVVEFAFHLELATCLAGSRSLDVIGVVGVPRWTLLVGPAFGALMCLCRGVVGRRGHALVRGVRRGLERGEVRGCRCAILEAVARFRRTRQRWLSQSRIDVLRARVGHRSLSYSMLVQEVEFPKCEVAMSARRVAVRMPTPSDLNHTSCSRLSRRPVRCSQRSSKRLWHIQQYSTRLELERSINWVTRDEDSTGAKKGRQQVRTEIIKAFHHYLALQLPPLRLPPPPDSWLLMPTAYGHLASASISSTSLQFLS